MKFEHKTRLSDSDCEVIIHCFGTFSNMNGDINKAIDFKFPNVYYNLCLFRKCNGLKIGNCLITREDKKSIISMFPALYDYDIKSSNASEFDEIYFFNTLQNVYKIMEHLDWLNKKIAIPSYFGIRNAKQQFKVAKAVDDIFGSTELLFYDKI